MKDLATLAIPAWDIVLRCAVVYILMVAGLRLFGKREVGQFTVFDFVLVLLIANAVQPAMTGPDSSLTGGVIIIATLLILNLVVGQLRERSRLFRQAIQPQPTVICHDGRWLDSALRREGLDVEDVDAAVREHGLDSVRDVKLAILESDGTISIVPAGSDILRTKRRQRYRRRPG